MPPSLSPLEEAFRPLGEVRSGTLLLPADVALVLIAEARAAGVPVLGIDGFEPVGSGGRPLLDCILDLSASGPLPPDTWGEAERFLGGRSGRGWLFEVVLGSSADIEPDAAADTAAR